MRGNPPGTAGKWTKGSNAMTLIALFERVRLLSQREKGQTMAEYAVVLAVITVAILLALQTLAGGISNALGDVTAVL